MTTQSQEPSAPKESTPTESEPLHVEVIRPQRSYWLQIVFFGLALSVGLYPYLKKKFPKLEKVIQPSRYYQRLGHQSFKIHYFQQAIDQYKKALLYKGLMVGLSNSERSATEYQIARCYTQLRRYGRAIHYAQRAQITSPQWLPPYVLVVDLYTQLNQSEKFADYAKLLKERFPNRWNVWVMLGNGHRRLGQEKAAIDAYERSIQTLNASMTSLTQDSPEYRKLLKVYNDLQTQLNTWKATREKLTQASSTSQRQPPIAAPIPQPKMRTPTSQPYRKAPTTQKVNPKLAPFPIFRMSRSRVPIPRIRTHSRSQKLLTPP